LRRRAQCREDRKRAQQRIDPRESDPSKSDSYANEYVRRELAGRKRDVISVQTIAEAKRALLKLSQEASHGRELPPHPWHARPIGAITAREIVRELELLRDGDEDKGLKPRRYLANACFKYLRTFFAWAAKPTNGKVTVNPMLGIDKPWTGAKPRDLPWFSGPAGDVAIRAIWKAADKVGGTEGAFVKLMMLTGKRKSALANMRWEQIDAT
jgi:integrase